MSSAFWLLFFLPIAFGCETQYFKATFKLTCNGKPAGRVRVKLADLYTDKMKLRLQQEKITNTDGIVKVEGDYTPSWHLGFGCKGAYRPFIHIDRQICNVPYKTCAEYDYQRLTWEGGPNAKVLPIQELELRDAPKTTCKEYKYF